jgi:hypothetical protein
MSIDGDLAAALSTRLNCPFTEARSHIKFILDCADDPNFAVKFGKSISSNIDRQNEAMSYYWAVITFLLETQA